MAVDGGRGAGGGRRPTAGAGGGIGYSTEACITLVYIKHVQGLTGAALGLVSRCA